MSCPDACELMFKAGKRFYVWSGLGDGLYVILASTNLDEIISIMKEKGEDALVLKELTSSLILSEEPEGKLPM